MADFTSEIVTRTIRRWIVPCAEPWGACIGDVSDATAAACRVYREVHGMSVGAVIADDVIRFHVTDEGIVIEFTVEEPSS